MVAVGFSYWKETLKKGESGINYSSLQLQSQGNHDLLFPTYTVHSKPSSFSAITSAGLGGLPDGVIPECSKLLERTRVSGFICCMGPFIINVGQEPEAPSGPLGFHTYSSSMPAL